MRFTLPVASALEARLDLLVLPRSEEQGARQRGALFGEIDRRLDRILSTVARTQRFTGKREQSLLLHSHHRLPAAQVALLGVGPDAELNLSAVRRLAARALRLAEAVGARRIGVVLPQCALDADTAAVVEAAVEGARLARYSFGRYLTRGRRSAPLPEVKLFAEEGSIRAGRRGVARGEANADAVALARDLVNEPASALTPARLAATARKVARAYGIRAQVWGPREIARRHLRLLEAVAAGSRQPPRVVRLAYRGPGRPRCALTLIGKGVTFDAGGLDLKTAQNMLEMKADMAGAATVLGAIAASAARKVPAKITCYLVCSENLPGGGAFKPGDIVRSRAGLTVEIANTDAEGRLLLADVLAISASDGSDVVIDVATLTGACMIALGQTTAGLFTPDDALADLLRAAGQEAGEDLWRLPLTPELRAQLKSPVADLRNVGSRYGGAIIAALFLGEFAPRGVRWAHLDIAGPARATSDGDCTRRGGTGFGVGTLVRAIERLARQR